MGLFEWGRGQLGWKATGADVPIQDLRFTVLDTELTGLDERRDDIVSIGALHMQGGRIELAPTFQKLVNPKAMLDGRTVVIHKITPSQLEDMPPIDQVLSSLSEYVAGTVLLGHCLSLDLAFLNRDAKRAGLKPFRNAAVDTLSLYGWLRQRSADHPAFSPDAPGPGLFDLAAAFEIPVEEAHTALGDAYVTAQLFQRFLPYLLQAGVASLASLGRVGDPRSSVGSLSGPDNQPNF
jgi:DNA polymerase-3 subunit epsilon